MSYLICEKCENYYELNEGKSSFSYENCECGGKLNYSPKLNISGKIYSPSANQKIVCQSCGAVNLENFVECSSCGGKFINISKNSQNININIRGIAVGIGFLTFALILSILALFGTNIPQKAEGIPHNLLIAFGILTICITVISGLISSYMSGSDNFKNGIINGGLVGIILGIMVGITSESMSTIYIIVILSSLSVIGGIIGTYLRVKL
ncbi:MAG: YrzE family protein [Methanobacterium sp.]|nr:YrzE family protein [Methanobacterium sp.]